MSDARAMLTKPARSRESVLWVRYCQAASMAVTKKVLDDPKARSAYMRWRRAYLGENHLVLVSRKPEK